MHFLSVSEGTNTEKGLDTLVFSFTNVINSFFVRQASTKTKAAHRARAKDGRYLGSRTPFGYIKDPPTGIA